MRRQPDRVRGRARRRDSGGEADRRRVVAGYNEDDCRATLALRDWLEERRGELAGTAGSGAAAPCAVEEVRATEDPELARIRDALLADVPDDPSARSAEQNAKALLADLLDWHRREDKPGWWRYFYLRTLGPAELIGESDALGGLTGGDIVEELKRSVVRRFFFPPQEHRFAAGDTAHDSVTDKGWTVVEIDDASGVIDLKIGVWLRRPAAGPLVPEGGPSRPRTQRDRLRDLGARVVRDGVGGRDAATALLLRLPPRRRRHAGRAAAPRGRDHGRRGCPACPALRDSYLPIQGPPGTGKTFTAADRSWNSSRHGRTVGITGPSHAVINNLIGKVCECADARGSSRASASVPKKTTR